MTGRLIKYELRSSIKLMGVIWAALIVTSFLFSIRKQAMWTAPVTTQVTG